MKKFLATVSAVALSLAMAALPAVTATADETVPPETVVTETTVIETPEATVPEATVPEATVPETTVPEATVPDTTVPETTVPETTVPETTVPDTTVPETTVPETTEPETFGPMSFGALIIELDLEVEVDGTATDQVCEASGDESVGTLVQGSIQLTVSDSDGVTKIEYSKDGGSTSEVNLATLLIEDLAPGKYDFVVTVAVGYESVDDFSITVKADNDPECNKQTICHWTPGGKGELGKYVEIDVSIKSIINVPNGHHLHENDIIPPFDYYDGDTLVSYPGLNFDPQAEGCDDADLPTEGPVIPEVIFTPATCDTDGSYTLIAPPLTEGVPADAVSFFVNDVETAPGTYPVAVGDVVTVKVVANYPADFPLDIGGSFYEEYTYPAFAFTAPTGCSLTTLALTGAEDTTPALALTAFLGLLGLAMVRSGSRINRNRQEA